MCICKGPSLYLAAVMGLCALRCGSLAPRNCQSGGFDVCKNGTEFMDAHCKNLIGRPGFNCTVASVQGAPNPPSPRNGQVLMQEYMNSNDQYEVVWINGTGNAFHYAPSASNFICDDGYVQTDASITWLCNRTAVLPFGSGAVWIDCHWTAWPESACAKRGSRNL